jgi:hypothetical protein
MLRMLHGGVPATIFEVTTLWLTFPGMTTTPDAPLRLYIILCAGSRNAAERLSFGF